MLVDKAGLVPLRAARAPRSALFSRSIYLHTGPRVAGLRRDPKEAFKTHTGIEYGSSEATSAIKQFLANYSIPEEMARQVLTHKSFGNGIKVYNEKLVVMGSKVLSLFLAKHVIEQQTSNENAINGKNLDVLGTPVAKELGGKTSLGLFAKQHNLNQNMFWKSHNHHLTFESSGEMKVSAHMMYALVGAVAYVHGKKSAEEFVREKFLKGDKSLEAVTEQLIQESQNQS
ncbi:hypothetical protein FT663_01153 [Candidozyma haemuli var. vulneris]|uniref:RNase III domain-containing protein n=1 Tax=Candidozyma haemuli TaxID=45357 RepID=A0A2V1AVU3_9ASCO|nr:hypothetical protein CXQ85_004902 [[Candida] haemuloni]KAF3992316.1 hypothetical protein FT662_01188 [[Candida] haemuloni var. vulneris]KAF3994686.1 hypothetical protein FT663_01153 [[Candida] haemuloni var. vulneris]PVH22230.1 hypothetical protein CXQ85_004902 [[Candida] haemuloni]